MTTPLEAARALLEAEVQSLGRPAVDSVDWFSLRAKSLALSVLRRAEQLGLGSVSDGGAAVERFVKNARTACKVADAAEDSSLALPP